MTEARIALLYQAAEPPAVDGVNKPMKPGGYQDSGADIAYALQQRGHMVVTPQQKPDPAQQAGWCFPDSEEGILAAIEKGANVLWANTILFASHPLQTSARIEKENAQLRIVGQPPLLVDQYDDKNFVNSMLREDGRFTIPMACIVDTAQPAVLSSLSYPVVGKPIRGRGSYGVRVCQDQAELTAHLSELLQESSQVMIEEYLPGQEGTVSVLPPSADNPAYIALPTVVRFDHHSGVAPYNGVVAVMHNSRVPSDAEFASTPAFHKVQRECELVAEKLKATATIRIDVRQLRDEPQSEFAIFDVNMKPNMTGTGRPGREEQASLTAIAAAKMGWTYAELLERLLSSAQPLSRLRQASHV